MNEIKDEIVRFTETHNRNEWGGFIAQKLAVSVSQARADLKREMMEKMPKEVEITRLDRKTDNDQRLEGYNQAVSEIKQIWEQIN